MTASKILIVEDSGIILLDIQKSLKNLGYTIAGTASTKEEAIYKTETTHPDLVLMDIRLGDDVNGGIDASNHIRAHFDVPVVFLTGFADEETFQRAKITDAFGYILKPFDPKTLRTTIEMALHKHDLEKRLRESEQRYRALVELAPEAVFVHRDGKFLFANRAGLELFRASNLDELVGTPIVERVHPDYRKVVGERVQAAISRGEVVPTIEEVFIRMDGSLVDVEVVATAINYQGQPCMLTVARDITERKQAGEAIRASNETLSAIINVSPLAITVLDMDGNVQVWNPAAEKIFGWKADEILGKPNPIVPPDLQSQYQHLSQKVFSEGYIRQEDLVRQRKDGSLVYVSLSSATLFDQDGKPRARMAIVADITERKQNEQKLIASEARYRSLFEQSHDAVFLLDLHGNHIMANQRAADMLGYTFDEMQNMTMKDLSAEFEQSTNVVERLRNGENLPMYERKFRKKGGEIITVEINAELIRDDNGTPLHIQSLVRDITHRKQAEIKLQKSEFLLQESQKIAGIGHYDLNILTGLWESSETLNELFGIDPDYQTDVAGWLDIIHPEDRQVMTEYLSVEVLGQKLPFDKQYRIVRKSDNQVRWVHGRGKLELDAAGNSMRMIGNIQDITEQKLNETIMQTRLRLIEYSLDHPLDALLQKTLDEAEIMTNSKIGFYHFMDDDQNTLILQNWSTRTKTEFCTAKGLGMHYPVSDAGVWVDCVYQRKPVIHNDYASLTHHKGLPEGHAKVTRELVVPVMRGDKIVAILGVGNKEAFYDEHDIRIVSTMADHAWEIAERKRAEEAQKRSETQYHDLVETAQDLIWQCDAEGRYTYLNPAWEKVFGYSLREMLGRPFSDFLHPAMAAQDITTHMEMMEGQTITGYETINLGKNHNEIHLVFNAKPIQDEHGNITGMSGTAYDITERKKAERNLRAKTDELESLFTISTHLRSAQSADEMLPLVLEQVHQILDSDASAVILLDPDGEFFTVALAEGLLQENCGLKFRVDSGINGIVYKNRQAMVIDDLSSASARVSNLANTELLGPALYVPILSEAEFLGILLCSRLKDRATKSYSAPETRLFSAIGEMVGNALRRARLYDQAFTRLQHLQALHSIDLAISANLDIKLTLEIVLNQVITLPDQDSALILLLDPYTHRLEYAAGLGLRTKAAQSASVRIGEGITGWVAQNKRTHYIPSLNPSEQPLPNHLKDENPTSYVGIPLVSKSILLGVLEVFSRSTNPNKNENIDYLEALAIQAAIAIDNAHLFSELQSSNLELSLAYDATIEGWSRALELRDQETEGHTLRVTDMTLKLAENMGLYGKELVHIRYGSLLHDIGKMGIPDKVLLKQGPLDDSEWEIMKKHPVYAFEMLWQIDFLRPAVDIPHCHHEKWDGTGYPRHLKGDEIPLAARVFCIADVYDALTSDRSYRKAWKHQEAVEYIKAQSGKHFQPEVVELFLQVVGET